MCALLMVMVVNIGISFLATRFTYSPQKQRVILPNTGWKHIFFSQPIYL